MDLGSIVVVSVGFIGIAFAIKMFLFDDREKISRETSPDFAKYITQAFD